MKKVWTGRMEFIVTGVQATGGGIDVIGRCGDYAIELGDVFDVVYRLIPTPTPDGYGPDVREGDRAVQLRVEKIEAYQKSLGDLGPGMTARLSLAGTGGDLVRNEDVLGRALDEVSERRRRS
jgi:hypothetical protein